MLDFFKRLTGSNIQAPPQWLDELRDNHKRWFVFLDKLEEKMDELGRAAVPELIAAMREDADPYHRVHYNMLLGVKGQYHHIRGKAHQVLEEKVAGFFNFKVGQQAFGSEFYQLLQDFYDDCTGRYETFEEKYLSWLDLLDETGTQDLERQYQAILHEYEEIKDRFCCKQCGAQLSIPKLFFINSYIGCPYCHTQNTFEPSMQAKQLEHLGRSLAEQRTKHLLKAYEADKNPASYERYLREMFDEWNKIVPDLQSQNERFYERMLEDFRRYPSL